MPLRLTKTVSSPSLTARVSDEALDSISVMSTRGHDDCDADMRTDAATLLGSPGRHNPTDGSIKIVLRPSYRHFSSDDVSCWHCPSTIGAKTQWLFRVFF
jgi:hypothetical protein